MNQRITVFANNVLAEYKTKKAAEKFAARVIGNASVIKAYDSVFDMLHKKGNPLFQVVIAQEATHAD